MKLMVLADVYTRVQAGLPNKQNRDAGVVLRSLKPEIIFQPIKPCTCNGVPIDLIVQY